MGSTFTLSLLRKTGRLADMKKLLISAFESMGYVKSTAREPDALAISVYAPRKGLWIALDLPVILSDDEEFIRNLSLHTQTPALSFFNFDSDLMLLRLTDGVQTQSIHCGVAADSLPEPFASEEALALFDTLLPNQSARISFREIIRLKPDFSEEIADRLAPLLGYPEALVYTDELHDPSAVLYFMPPDKQLPFLLPETDPPALSSYSTYTLFSNPTHISVRPCGGKGKGVRLLIVALDYDAEDWHVPIVALRRGPFDWHEHSPDEYIHTAPVRCSFASGKKGWYADFPDVEIAPGLHRFAFETNREKEYIESHCLTVHVPFCGGRFHHDYHTADSTPDSLGGKTRLILAPIENPEGFASATVPRHPFKQEYWHKPWLGDAADEYK